MAAMSTWFRQAAPGDDAEENCQEAGRPRAETDQTVNTVATKEPDKYEKKGGMFVDAAAMKEKLRQNMIKPEYDVCDFYVTTGLFQQIARSKIFENVTLAVIAFNALWISIDTDLNSADSFLSAHPVFQFMEHFFCFYFTFEWLCRFSSFKIKRNGLRDAWFCFDSFMVFMMVAETWVMTGVLLATGAGSGGSAMGDASILRLLRLLRLSRMARMAKLLRSMPELLILIKGMVSAMRSVFFTLLLLTIIIYIFAIAFRQLTADTDAGRKFFPTIPDAMHTLLLDGTLMDGPGNVVQELEKQNVAFVLFFYLFILLAALTVMNMLIGVLCEVVSAVAATEKEQITVGTVKDGFLDIIENGGLDQDGDKMISRVEFEAILDDPESTRLLTNVEVDVYGLVDLADYIFIIEGTDEEKQLSFVDFMELVLSLRGTNVATVKDIVDLRKFVQGALKGLEEKIGKAMAAPPGGGSRGSRGSVRDNSGSRVGTAESTRPARPCSPLVPPQATFENMDNGEGSLSGRDSKQMSFGSGHIPVNPSGEALAPEMFTKSVRLEGVLNAARTEIDRFTDILSRDPILLGDYGVGTTGREQGVARQHLLELKSRVTRLEQELAKGVSELKNARDGTCLRLSQS